MGGSLAPDEPAKAPADVSHNRLISRMQASREPCRDCPLWQRCADEQLACKDFMHFVNSNRCNRDPTDRAPTHALYQQIFATEDARASVVDG
ncbi:hypothetical protein QWY84_11110 [Aquisalimonas lutea]|uniref:hypothetical protein n=1 Tax=Aquisalimonas lutea TaxID=1327750 RepID=UPI0025B2CA06|nr:hypothetical protein [Aquisalimonas lutea]MDN3518160.1 hypothetical protein [Aquisalimonas lutea]